MKTLPDWCREWGESLDVARVLLRQRPALAKLATMFGAQRVFDATAAKKIRAALIERRESRLASAS